MLAPTKKAAKDAAKELRAKLANPKGWRISIRLSGTRKANNGWGWDVINNGVFLLCVDDKYSAHMYSHAIGSGSYVDPNAAVLELKATLLRLALKYERIAFALSQI